MKGPTRREVIVGALAAAAGTAAAPLLRAAEAERSRVVLVRARDAVGGGGSIDARVVHRMLDDAVARLLGEEAASAAWRRLVGAKDVVGIKTNRWERLPTPAAVETALRRRVLGAGVAPDAVAVTDRGVRHDPVFRRATALINTRPMRAHAWSGLGTCIKNYIPFSERPSQYHPNGCEGLGALWDLPEVKGKTRLNVLVMLTPQFHGVGPHSFSPEYVWPYGGLIVSRDPVAADTVGAAIIAAKRRSFFGDDRPLVPTPHHIRVAGERYGLGEWRTEAIELVRLGNDEGSLI